MAVTVTPERAAARGVHPRGLNHLWIPLAGRRAVVAGLSMHAACKPASVALQRAMCAAIIVGGPGLLPGRHAGFQPPLAPESWSELVGQWRSRIGRWDAMVLYRRPQSGRRGFAVLLLRDGRGLAFIRVSADPHRTAREFTVMLGVHAARPRTFRIARPLASGTAAGCGWMALESGPNYPLGAVRRPKVRRRVVAEVRGVLETSLERPAGTPDHWQACHGDLAPWNLRIGLDGRVWVGYWEDAGFAPHGADRLYSELTAQITFGGPVLTDADPECIQWMATVIGARRSPAETPDSENARLLTALARLSRG
jgi:hypothetical protein